MPPAQRAPSRTLARLTLAPHWAAKVPRPSSALARPRPRQPTRLPPHSAPTGKGLPSPANDSSSRLISSVAHASASTAFFIAASASRAHAKNHGRSTNQ
eukprot:2407581-Prymnesium_polylepis.1